VPANSVTELRPAGSARPQSRAGTPAVTTYDFRRPNKLSRDHARLLQMICETFGRRLTTLLTSGLRQVCQVSLQEVIQQSYDEYVAELPSPTLVLPLSLPPLPGTATLQFSLPVALAAIDHMLGGPGGTQHARSLTDIEAGLLSRLTEQILSVLRYSLEPLIVVEPVAGSIEYNPQFLQAASASDTVVVSVFEMTVGKESCRMTLSFPLASLLPPLHAHRPRAARAEALGRTGAHMRESLNSVPIEVSVRFRPLLIDSARVLSLAPGDVLVLDHRVGGPLNVQAGSASVGRAVAGKAGNRLAALIVDNTPYAPKEQA
jgi:flagellar motor switch protein FliM